MSVRLVGIAIEWWCAPLSNDVCVPHADVAAQVLADGIGEREAVEVAKPIPRVLHHVEQHKEQNKEKQECWYPHQHHDPLHDTKDIVLCCLSFHLLLLLHLLHIFQAMVGHKDSGEEKSENKAANVSKIINEGEETEEEEEEDDHTKLEELHPRSLEEA